MASGQLSAQACVASSSFDRVQSSGSRSQFPRTKLASTLRTSAATSAGCEPRKRSPPKTIASTSSSSTSTSTASSAAGTPWTSYSAATRTVYSRISSTTRRCDLAPLARTIARSARAILPWRPITFPTSAFATRSWRTVAPSRCTSSTSTASGSSTSRRARCASSSATDVGLLEQPCDRVRGRRALRQPRLDLLLVEVDRRRVGLRVVAAHDLDELAVSRRARVGNDHPVDRVLLRPDTGQAHANCHLSPLLLSLLQELRWEPRHFAFLHLLHHLLHLLAGREQLVDLLDRGAAARSDPLAA